MNLQTLIIIGIILVLVITSEIVISRLFNKWINFKYKELQLKQYDIDIHLNISSDIETRLDTVIESCFQEHSLMNLIYKTDWYIKENEEIQISKDICALVSDRISPVMIKQLSLYYNEEAIFDIIANSLTVSIIILPHIIPELTFKSLNISGVIA